MNWAWWILFSLAAITPTVAAYKLMRNAPPPERLTMSQISVVRTIHLLVGIAILAFLWFFAPWNS